MAFSVSSCPTETAPGMTSYVACVERDCAQARAPGIRGVSAARSLKRNVISNARAGGKELAAGATVVEKADDAPDEASTSAEAPGAATPVADTVNVATLDVSPLKGTSAYSAAEATPPMQRLEPGMAVTTWPAVSDSAPAHAAGGTIATTGGGVGDVDASEQAASANALAKRSAPKARVEFRMDRLSRR